MLQFCDKVNAWDWILVCVEGRRFPDSTPITAYPVQLLCLGHLKQADIIRVHVHVEHAGATSHWYIIMKPKENLQYSFTTQLVWL